MSSKGIKLHKDQVAGYVFVLDNRTFPDDISSYLLGLHCEHQESVRVKLIGLPSFLYNSSTDCLYGAFEASYEGGLKPALPDLWQRNLCKNGQPSALRNNSKVRIHMCKLRDLPQGNLPFVTDATNVMSELSFSEVKNLLTILSVSSLNISEEIEDENDDGWKKVKSKYQSRRQVHPDFSKGFSSPNRLSGRRQGTHSSSTQNGAEDSPVSHNKNSFRYKTSRGSYENRADATENWRTESKIGNQFRSANVLKLPLCEDVQIYKGYEQSGANGETADLHSQRDPTTQFCSSAREVDFQQLSRNDSSSVDSPGESESMQNICVKSSFESYSAALKSGIHDDGSDTCTVTQIVSRGESNSSNRSEGAGSTDSCSSPCSVNGFPFSAVSEIQWGETLTDPQFLSELNSKHGYSSDDNHNMLPLSDTSDEQCNHKQFVGIFSNADGSESATTGCEEEEHGSRNRSGSARDHKRSSMTPKHASETPCNIEKDEEIPTHDQPANFDLSGSEGNEFPGNSWMNGELSTSGRFYDPDPAVNSGNVVLDSFPGQRIGAENCGQPPPHQRPHQLYPSLRMRGRSQGVRLPDSKQFPFSVPSKACYTKTSMPKLLRQGKRAQESHRRNAEGLQHIYHEGTARQQSRNRKTNVPWPLTRATDCRAYLPCPFPFPSFDLLQNPQLIHPPPQMHWGMQSPFLLFLPTISPLIGITSTVLPLPPPVQSGRAFLETLHADILKFAKVTRPAANIRAGVESAIMCVSDTVKQLWPGADVEVFGSFSTGLCLSHSDVDVAVTLASTLSTTNSSSNTRPHGVAPLIRELAASLCQHPWCENLSTIETASMPVIKLECRTQLDNCPTSNSSVAIDITISGKRRDCTRINHKSPAMTGVGPRVAHNGAAARDYVVGKLCQFPALAPLVLVMKSYLDHRKLNDVYSGGLGSFALTLLLVFYLERVSTPCEVMEKLPATTASMQESSTNNLLQPPDNETSDSSIPNRDSVSAPAPCQGSDSSQFSEILNRADRIVTEALGSMESSNIMNLATLLLGFLHTFGHHINLSSVRLVLKGTEDSPNGLLPLPQIASPVALWIEDPLNPGANVGAGSFNMWHVQAAMRDMFYVLTKSNCNLSSLASENDSSSGRCLLGQLFMPSTRPQAA